MALIDLSSPDLWSQKYLPALVEPKTYNILWGGAGSGKSSADTGKLDLQRREVHAGRWAD